MKTHWNECGERILLGDNTGGGTDMVRPIRFRCVGVWISAGLRFLYICIWRMYVQFRIAPPTNCARLSALQLLRKSGSVCTSFPQTFAEDAGVTHNICQKSSNLKPSNSETRSLAYTATFVDLLSERNCLFLITDWQGRFQVSWDLKLMSFLRSSLTKEVQNHEYKIMYESEYLFRWEKDHNTLRFLKSWH
jgi:hypothetical protein